MAGLEHTLDQARWSALELDDVHGTFHVTPHLGGERIGVGATLHEQVDITPFPRFPPSKRAKQPGSSAAACAASQLYPFHDDPNDGRSQSFRLLRLSREIGLDTGDDASPERGEVRAFHRLILPKSRAVRNLEPA